MSLFLKMLRSRTTVLILGVLLLLLGCVLFWRATHPPLSDEQKIKFLLEGARSAIATCNTNRLTFYLAEDFTWNGQSKSELKSMARGAFFQARDLEPSIFGVKISVQDETANVTGSYSLRYRIQNTKTSETQRGHFQIVLEKRDNAWKIIRAQNGK